MFKLSNRATLDEINKLIELQLLKPKGKGKALHYNKNGMCLIKLFYYCFSKKRSAEVPRKVPKKVPKKIECNSGKNDQYY